MVEKKVFHPERSYLTRRAKEVKATSSSYIARHTRKCYELNQAVNSKETIEKPLTKSQQQVYSQELERQRLKEEGKARRQKKKEDKKKNVPISKNRKF